MVKIINYLAALLLPALIHAQGRWAGVSDNGFWSSPTNWVSGIAPLLQPSEDVLLDNSVNPESYTVTLSGTDSIVIHSLLIAPAPGKTIRLIIDPSSKVSVALSITAPQQGIIISEGGSLINRSGAAEGPVIYLADSLRIENGGLYSHGTTRAHAALVSRLSRRPGTEKGVFEFNIPSASNTLSLSNQVYGTLRLSSLAYGNNCTYSGGAVNPLLIRGNLELGTGVTLSLNFSDTVRVEGDYLQAGGSFNLANSTRAATFLLEGDLEQTGGLITKTGSAVPLLLLRGSHPQHIRLAGGLAGNIIVRTDNAAGVHLLTPLIIPWQLELQRGRIVTAPDRLLVLASGSSIKADSASNASFIEGPLRKEGLVAADNFLFPVGKNGLHRWLSLRQATGNFTVEYQQNNPAPISVILEAGLHHLSGVEYWKVDADALPAASGIVMLSYGENSSGGVTDLSSLRVAGYVNNRSWTDGGNEGTTGSAGASGSVQSRFFEQIGPGARFTLAGSVPVQNPLPLALLAFDAVRKHEYVSLRWQLGEDYPASHFEVQASTDARVFIPVITLPAEEGVSRYSFDHLQKSNAAMFYRLLVTGKSGLHFYSKIVEMGGRPLPDHRVSIINTAPGTWGCRLYSDKATSYRLELYSMAGARLMIIHRDIMAGENTLRFAHGHLPPGIYILSIWEGKKPVSSVRLMK